MNTVDPASIFDQVLSFINYTNQSIFLTGKAGTGKTTLLRRIKDTTKKKMAVIAPTGVAAINAKGTTINSFFQLPPGSFFPGDISLENLQSGILSIQTMVRELSYSREKINLFNELELLVIDEISMVRCDLLDVIDAVLRAVRTSNLPFGGVQLLLIGDLYQLPPVTKREEWSFLSRVYASPYFFDSLVIRKNPLLQIELTQVFRQTEPEFIKILNDIRNNEINDEDLAVLNGRYEPNFVSSAQFNPIIITSHNAEANTINQQKLAEIEREEFTLEAEVSGEFKDLGVQAEQSLKLKVGAQVMFIKNDSGVDRKFYNGKIGKVKSIQASVIYISFPEEEDLLLEKSSWQSFEYKVDAEQLIVQQQVGELLQYPIKLAWAVTIHKSQGLTFDHAIIDAGKSFVSGQVYVALSRVRTLNGLILKSKIGKDSLRSNRDVIQYMKPVETRELASLLHIAQEKFILQLVLNRFSFHRLLFAIGSMESNPELLKANVQTFKLLLSSLRKSVETLVDLADRFQLQVQQLHEQMGFEGLEAIQARIVAAASYFNKEATIQLLNPVNKNIRIKAKNKVEQQMQHSLQQFRLIIDNKLVMIQIAADLLKDPIPKTNYLSWIEQYQPKPQKASAAASQQVVTLQLF